MVSTHRFLNTSRPRRFNKKFLRARQYKELQCSEVIASRFEQCAHSQDQTYAWASGSVSGASTDQGSWPRPTRQDTFMLIPFFR